MWVLPGWAWRCGATLLCVTGPSTRRKASTALDSFKRIGIPILAAVFSLACLVMVGFLSMAPAFLSPFLLPLLGTATAWQTQLRTQGSAGTGSATFLLSPQRQALSLPSSMSSALSSPFPSSQGLPGLPLLLLQTAPEAGAAAAGV